MKIIGFRCSPKCVRYALVDMDGNTGTLLNAGTENRFLYPAGMDELDDRLVWLYSELERLFHQHKDIDRAVVKANEYLVEKKATRSTNYADAVIVLACAKHGVPVEPRTYGKLGTTSGKAQDHAEHRVGRTDTHWDRQMADAVIAAWSGRK
jgi:Holliday junction resolvasome RuvABC endonuclease subunit